LREHLLLVDDAISRVPTLFCPRNSRSFQGVFKGFLHFFKVSLNIPNELRDSPNQSLNVNWTEIAYYIEGMIFGWEGVRVGLPLGKF
jgi:hypothetical protein